MWGARAALRVEAGPLRWRLRLPGKGLGLFYALQRRARPRTATHELRTFTGFYGQAALDFGRSCSAAASA